MDYEFSSPPESQDTTRQPIDPTRLLNFGVNFGIGLIVLAIIWAGVLEGKNVFQAWFPVQDLTFLLDIVLGLAIGTVFAIIVWVFGQMVPGFETVRERLMQVIDFNKMHMGHVIGISFVAAMPEEIFFRGAMQPALGLWITALIFGTLHAMTIFYWIYAIIAGLLLGAVTEWRDSLWMAIGVHFAVDFFSLWLLMRWSKLRQQQKQKTTFDIQDHPTLSRGD